MPSCAILAQCTLDGLSSTFDIGVLKYSSSKISFKREGEGPGGGGGLKVFLGLTAFIGGWF